MSISLGHPVVGGYLAQLDAAAAAAGVSGGRRAELRTEIRGHLDDALAAAPELTDAVVAEVLDRLGPVEEIVAAEVAERPTDSADATRWAGSTAGPTARVGTTLADRSWGPLEVAAAALLSVGALLVPVISTVAGLICTWRSQRWSRTTKMVATALGMIPVLLFTGFLALGSLLLVNSSPAGVQESVPVSTVQQGSVP